MSIIKPHGSSRVSYQLQVSAKILSWPRQCACCGGQPNGELRAAASRTTGKRVQHTTTSWWHVPYCSSCLHHKAQYDEASKWSGKGVAAGVVAWILFGWLTASGWFGFVVCVALASWGLWHQGKSQEKARKLMCETCSTPSAAVRYIAWHGTFHTFVFENKAYLDSFAVANSRKTMSDVRKL